MDAAKNEISGYQTALMSVTAGICVATIYYNQPLLHDMALSLQIGEGETGNIAVFAQGGYGLGLFFLTPLGDKVNRRNLILCLQLFLVIALLGMAFAQGLYTLMTMSLFTGLFAVAAQVILPMAAYLSPHNKGKVVGVIFTGILTGILAARVFSGFIADWLSWRYVYAIAAAMVFVSALALYRALPDTTIIFRGSYGALLQSTLSQFKRFALLRRTAVLGALMFGTFCSFWTTLTFHLSAPPYRYSTDTIGLFGLLAIVSALMAPLFGKLADRGGSRGSRLIAVALVLLAIGASYYREDRLWAILAAVLLLDLGVQAIQVTNVAIIYTLDETAHSRINTAYMTAYFLGGALGTFSGLWCWKAGGWPAVCVQLFVCSALSLILLLLKEKAPAPGR